MDLWLNILISAIVGMACGALTAIIGWAVLGGKKDE